MAKDRDIISSYLKYFPKIESDHTATQNQLERDLSRVLSDYFVEIDKISETYRSFEDNHSVQYMQTEQDYQAAVDFINQEYNDLFSKNDHDLEKHERQTQQLIDNEISEFDAVMNKIADLKKDSYTQFQEMSSAIHKQIDHEMKVHHDFLVQEDQRFKSMKHAYQDINSQRANKLLWTIEESKNALIALHNQLRSDALNNSKFMNETIMSVLESLRETKNKMTFLFKSTSDLFNKYKSRVERLGRDREKPHTQLNQSVIRQYVKQIRDITQKRNTFEAVIKRELQSSLSILGKRILQYNQDNNRFETEKAIMQYEIVQKKSNYLLKHNQEMADLLISKYQNEIKKIKIDSFRRVEEIKLSYFMPATFFQNSINLYSNFAFYVNESFDDLDNLLSEFIRFNQRITEVKTDYIAQSAKTVEDFKIQVMVQVNSVTTHLTDMISKIDSLSKDIITLESRNQLEIAEIKKKMECADISGDYQKYIAELDNDEVFACFQHDINIQKINSNSDHYSALIALDRSVIEIHYNQQLAIARQRFLEKITLQEKSIHDLAYNRELAEIDARFERAKLELSLRHQLAIDQQTFQFAKLNYRLAQKTENLRQAYLFSQQNGSQQVIEYVHKAQKIIDFNDNKVSQYIDYTTASDDERDYAYFLEKTRQKLINNIQGDSDQKLSVNREAIQRIHHHFFDTFHRCQLTISDYFHHFQRLLLHLDNDFAVNQTRLLLQADFYQREIAYRIHAMYAFSIDSIQSINPNGQEISFLFDKRQYHFENFIVLTQSTKQRLLKPKLKPARKRSLLESYYVQSLELLESAKQTISKSLNRSELSALESDVLFVERHSKKSKATIELINREYDRLIDQAIRSRKHKNRQIAKIQREAITIDSILKKRVKKINDTFEKAMAGEREKLAYVKKNVSKIILDNNKALSMQKKLDTRQLNREMADLEKAYQDHVKAYLRLKTHTEETYVTDYNLITSNAQKQTLSSTKALEQIDRQVVKLPKEPQELIVKLDAEKEALISKRRGVLLQQLAHIEGQKFTSRPKFLEEIEAVKKRLPADYVSLYKEIQKAEDEFLHAYLKTESSFSEDFSSFLKQQTLYRQIIDQDQVPQIPFEKYHALSTRLFQKTSTNFDETIDKADLTMSLIKEQETKSKATQNRIING